MRRSCDAIETARAASPRSCASMNDASSSALPRSARRPTTPRAARAGAPAASRALAGARCSPRRRRVEQVRRLDRRPTEHVPRDQRRALPRRQDLQGGQERELDRLALDDDRVRLVVARRRPRPAARPGTAASTAPRESCSVAQAPRSCAGARRGTRSWRSCTATPGTAVPSNVSRLRHARRNVSCTASSASSNEASIR